MTTTLLVDDQPHVLAGLAMLLGLEPDLHIVGSATTGEEAIDLARQLHPDITVMDVRLPGIDGIAATRVLTNDLPDGKVVILSLYCDPETRRRARQAGARAFVSKHDMSNALLGTIRELVTQRPQLMEIADTTSVPDKERNA